MENIFLFFIWSINYT